MKNLLSVLVFTIVSSAANAQEFFWTVQPQEIITAQNYIGLRISGNQNSACYFAPLGVSFFVKPYTDPNTNAVLSVLLTAQATKRQVYLRVTDQLNQAGINNMEITNCYLDYATISM